MLVDVDSMIAVCLVVAQVDVVEVCSGGRTGVVGTVRQDDGRCLFKKRRGVVGWWGGHDQYNGSRKGCGHSRAGRTYTSVGGKVRCMWTIKWSLAASRTTLLDLS